MVKTWAAYFKHGRTSIFDEERSGQPKTATTYEMIDDVNEIVINKRDSGSSWCLIQTGAQHFIWRIKYEEAEHTLDAITLLIKNESISRWCPERFKQNKKDFLRFITVDATWVHQYTPEKKTIITVHSKRQTDSQQG